MNAAELRDAFRRYKDVLYRYAYRMTGSTSAAEDIVQESFLALWQGRATYDSERGDMRLFLLGVARKKILMQWRGEEAHEPLDDQPPRAVAETSISLQLIASKRAEMVARAVANLPPLQREALILAEYEEMSLEEISRATGMELAAVKSRLHRARQNLRHMLSPLLKSKGTLHGTKY